MSSFIHSFTIHLFIKHLLGFSAVLGIMLGGDGELKEWEKRGGKHPEMNNIEALLLLKLWRSKVMFYRVMSTILEVKIRYYGRLGMGPRMSQLTVVLS